MEHGIIWGMAALGLAIVALCVQIFGRLLASVRAGHGKVKVEMFGGADLMLATVLMTWLGGVALQGVTHKGGLPPITDRGIMVSTALFGMVVALIALLLRARQISALRLFGLSGGNRPAALRMGVKLFFAIMPLVFFCSVLVHQVAGEESQPQEIIKYFTDAARNADRWRLVLAGVISVLFAPMTEEFVFRGFFYGVLKRYFGAVPALLFVSALFAAIHVNLPALLPLFVLAVGLTLAYEATGSLLAPMVMHALFNAVMLGVMFYSAQHP